MATRKNFENVLDQRTHPAKQMIDTSEHQEEPLTGMNSYNVTSSIKAESPTKKIFEEDCPETKSARANLLLRPTTKESMKKLAEMQHTSFNDLISHILEEYVENHQKDIQDYEQFLKKKCK